MDFFLAFPLMLIIVFGAVALSVQKKRRKDDDDDDDTPLTGAGAFA